MMTLFAHLPHDLQRLRLRALRLDDLDALHACRSDAAVARYQGWEPMTPREAAEFLAAEAVRDDHAPDTWRQLAVAERASDVLIGDMGVWLSANGRQAEFGISLAAAVHGRGYGTESVRGLIALLFVVTNVDEIVASADARNRPCLAMLRRVGMREVDTRCAEYKGERCVEHVFRLSRPGG